MCALLQSSLLHVYTNIYNNVVRPTTACGIMCVYSVYTP